MHSANKFIDFFVHDILDFSVLNQNENNFTKIMTVFSVKTAVNEILDMLVEKIKMKNIKVTENYIGIDKDNFQIETDMKRLQQVLLNLVNNAVKFTERAGLIEVFIEVIPGFESAFLKLTVKDNGVGIKAENKDKMFKLFKTFKESNKNINLQGIGLGLAISKMIVEKFNGQINFESEYGKGSTFSFTFEMK